jgi:NAD(P)-dependent dehydrogenase (short-subunit alcohol dehydrogenase family)
MGRIFITGSTDGLGLAAARTLMSESHNVVLHARSRERASALADLTPRPAGIVIGDLSSAVETRAIADQVNTIGRMDAVIHNAGVYLEPSRGTRPEVHARTLAVNTLAPYILTALIERPDRLVYLSSGMHRSGGGSLKDIDWNTRRWNATQAYCESKLYVAALALAIARRWRCVEQRRRSRLGPHQNGRRRGSRRSGDGTPHPDLARRQRPSCRGRQWRVLASPAAAETGG